MYYWVEMLIFGSAVERFLHPERIIVGAADPSRPLPAPLDAGLRRFGCPILPMGYESAELTKTAINLYLFGAVTYANTLSPISAKRLGRTGPRWCPRCGWIAASGPPPTSARAWAWREAISSATS